MLKTRDIAHAASLAATAATWTVAQYSRKAKPALTKVGLSMVPQIAAWAAPRQGSNSAEKQLMTAGFALSALGDIGLGCGDDRGQIPGFVAFLAAQTVNTIAFAKRAPFGRVAAPFAIYGLAATAYSAWVWRKIADKPMRPAVAIYAASIATMAAQAASAAACAPSTHKARWTLAAVGGGLQFTSDAVLGYNLFVKKLPAGDAAVLYSYWAAQGLYAASLAP